MNTFDEEHFAFAQLEALAVVLTFARGEVELRNLDFLALQQRFEVALHGDVIYRLDVLEVITAVGELRCVLAIDEIVVGREGDRLQTARHKLDGETFAERGLARTGRTGDEYQADRAFGVVVAGIDVLGNLYNLLFLQGLAHLYQFGGVAVEACLIDGTHILQAHDDVPTDILGKDLEGLGLRFHFGQLGRVLAVGHTEQHTLLVLLDAKHFEITSRRNQGAIVIVDGVAQGVVVGIDLTAGLQQAGLVVETTVTEDAYRLLRHRLGAVERHILVDDVEHPFPNLGDVLLRCRLAVGFLEVTEIASRDRVFHIETTVRKDVLRGLVEYEAKRTDIGTETRVVAHVNKLYVTVLPNTELESLRRVVHLGRDSGVGEVQLRKGVEHLQQRDSLCETFGYTIILATYLDHSRF